MNKERLAYVKHFTSRYVKYFKAPNIKSVCTGTQIESKINGKGIDPNTYCESVYDKVGSARYGEKKVFQ